MDLFAGDAASCLIGQLNSQCCHVANAILPGFCSPLLSVLADFCVSWCFWPLPVCSLLTSLQSIPAMLSLRPYSPDSKPWMPCGSYDQSSPHRVSWLITPCSSKCLTAFIALTLDSFLTPALLHRSGPSFMLLSLMDTPCVFFCYGLGLCSEH